MQVVTDPLSAVPFRQKLQILLVLAVGISCGLLVWLSIRKANYLAFGLVREKTVSVAQGAASRFTDDDFSSLLSRRNSAEGGEPQIVETLKQSRDANFSVALPIRRLYLLRPVGEGRWEYFAGVTETEVGEQADTTQFALEKPNRKTAATPDHYNSDSEGTFLSATAPVITSDGKTVAIVVAEISGGKIQAILRKLLLSEIFALVIAVGIAAALASWLSRKVTRPLTDLRDFVRQLGQGELSARIKVKSDDEFGELGRAANLMAERLEERESLKGALVHYVRSQAADPGLADPDSGVRVKRKVTVLVAELCGFHQLSTKLGSERVFSLLNEYFSTMIDAILRHRGSLEKSTDKSVIAVFGSSGSDQHQERKAVEAALAMQHALAQLLHEWKIETNVPILLEIGIHTASALAAEDGEKQLEFESVHRIVEKATEVKNACRDTGDRLIVSETTANKLKQAIPLSPISTTTADFPLFKVEMPQPTLK